MAETTLVRAEAVKNTRNAAEQRKNEARNLHINSPLAITIGALKICPYFMLQNLDTLWREHLLNMDHMRDGIGLRGYGQKDPLQEYKKEGFAMFVSMLQSYMLVNDVV